jgi:1-acyl-sn-glycerol-3-phosphate acyltransferase
MWIGMWLCPFRGCGSAKKEIVRIPIFGLAYLLSGHLLIDRGNLESAKSSMEAAARVVKKHRLSLWMWPEGTRSKDGRLQPLKKGFVHMVIATGLPVIPVVSRNADLLWPGKTFRITPGDLDMEVLPPIDTSSWTLDDVDAAAKQVHDVFVAALPERQRPA